MSAIPLPKPEPEPGPAEDRARTGSDEDGWALLEALRRRLDDQAAQGRKTQVQVGQLADSIAALVAEQRRRSKWLNLNSFVAYLIFTVVVGAGFYALYRSRASELVDARNAARHERDLATQRADDASTKLAARERADATAWEAYQLLEAGKRSEAQAKLGTVGPQALSRTERAVLAARAHETQIMEVDAALKAAAAAFKAGRYGDVIAPLEAALVGEPAGARSGAMHYFLGVAYAKTNDLAKAVSHLQIAVASDTEHDDVRFQLASALDRSGQYAKARAEYDQFATAHPQSGLAVFAMRRSATLARMPAVSPTTSSPAPVTSPKSPAGTLPTTPPTPGTTPRTAGTPSAPAPRTTPAPSTPSGTMPSGTMPSGTTPPGATSPGTTTPPGTVTQPGTRSTIPPAPTNPPAKTTPAPAPKPATNEGSAAVTPLSTTPFDLRDGMATARAPLPDDATSARPANVVHGVTVSTLDHPTSLEAPPRDRAPTELPPTPKAGTPAPSLPAPPPVERAPTPTPEPPIDREPAPAPRTPPRADLAPPHERF